MDLIFELGIPGVVLGAIIFLTAFKTGRSLLARTAADPSLRSGMGFLVGLAAFEFIIANKAGTIWGNIDLFCYCCIIARLSSIPTAEEHLEPVDQADAEGDPADEFPEDPALEPELGRPELARMAER
jgi:hypothetical protein